MVPGMLTGSPKAWVYFAQVRTELSDDIDRVEAGHQVRFFVERECSHPLLLPLFERREMIFRKPAYGHPGSPTSGRRPSDRACSGSAGGVGIDL